jgi:integrase
LIANGVDIKTVSKRLGHANIQTTGNIYTHQIKSADEQASEVIDLVLRPKKAADENTEE